jgi:putative chitinase
VPAPGSLSQGPFMTPIGTPAPGGIGAYITPGRPAWLVEKPAAMKVIRTSEAELKTLAGAFKPNPEVLKILAGDTSGLLWFHSINRSGLRLCHFLSQVAHESSGFSRLAEGLTYTTAARILEVFGTNHSAKVTAEEAEALVKDAKGLAERVYGNGNPIKAKELGNDQAGDGFLYRGRGLIQITGKAMYRQIGDHPDVALDLVGQPQLAEQPMVALKTAVAFWKIRKLDELADADDVTKLTKRINGGTNGLGERKELLETAKHMWLERAPT